MAASLDALNMSPELMVQVVGAVDPIKYLMAVPALGAAATGITRSFVIVHRGEMGTRTSSGNPVLQTDVENIVQQQINAHESKARTEFTRRDKYQVREETLAGLDPERTAKGIYKVVAPGLYGVHPFVGGIAKVNVTDRTTGFSGALRIESSDETIHEIKPAFTWHVRSDADNPYNARFKINNDKDNKDKERDKALEHTVTWACVTALGLALRNRSNDGLINCDPDELTETTRQYSTEATAKYGIMLDNVWFEPVARTAEERLAQAIEKTGDPELAGALGSVIRIDKDKGLQAVPDESA